MSDIAARLKDHYADKDTDAWMSCLDAADEIERLRSALEAAADRLFDAGLNDAWADARAALEGK